jgi:hypothetical protein
MMRIVLFATALALATPSAGRAQPPGEPPMTEPELAAQRGGLMTPMGLDVGFGATIRTYVDGQQVLQTQLTWTDKGPVTQTVGADGAPSATTFVSPGAGGSTEVMHILNPDRIASVVVNTANGRNIRQDTDITLAVPQLQQFQQQVSADRITAGLQSALGLAVRDSASH